MGTMNEFNCGPQIIDSSRLNDLMLKEIAATKVIDRETEKALFVRYQTADEQERDQIKATIIQANLRFVLKVAMYYRNRSGQELADLVSESKIGMAIAVDLFDYTRGYKFYSFAVWHIKCRMSKFLEKSDMIRLPSYKKIKLNREKKEAAKSGELMTGEFAVLGALNALTRLDSAISDDSTIVATVADASSSLPDREYISTKLTDSLEKCMDSLDPIEKNLIHMVYGIGLEDRITLREASRRIGVGQDKAKSIRDSAIRKMHAHTLSGNIREMALAIDIL